MLTRTSRSPLTSILATAALIGYVCLVMTCIVVATEDHCGDDHCSELGDCHCACGLWGLSHTEIVVPQPRPADLIDVAECHRAPAEPAGELFRPPRAGCA